MEILKMIRGELRFWRLRGSVDSSTSAAGNVVVGRSGGGGGAIVVAVTSCCGWRWWSWVLVVPVAMR